jgi:hypothetical protein
VDLLMSFGRCCRFTLNGQEVLRIRIEERLKQWLASSDKFNRANARDRRRRKVQCAGSSCALTSAATGARRMTVAKHCARARVRVSCAVSAHGPDCLKK